MAMFRERLLQEVREAEGLAAGDQSIQPYMSCIAALLRKIMTRTGDSLVMIKVKVYERGNGDHIKAPRWEPVKMSFLTNKILHYQEFLPAVDWATLDDTKRTCTILSDKEDDVFRRLVNIDDFLSAAKRVASDDEAVLTPLLRHARTRLGKMVYGPDNSSRDEIEAVESLIDVFDLARAMKKDASVEGAIEVHGNVMEGTEIVGVRTWSVSYTTLVRNLFKSWSLAPFRQFRAAVEGKEKMLDIEAYDEDYRGAPLMIGAEDMMSFLGSAQKQWVREFDL